MRLREEPVEVLERAEAYVGDRLVVVHNGMLENYLELKERLQAEGHVFKSETDTEVLAHLFEHHLRSTDRLEEAVRRGLLEVRGFDGIPQETNRVRLDQRSHGRRRRRRDEVAELTDPRRTVGVGGVARNVLAGPVDLDFGADVYLHCDPPVFGLGDVMPVVEVGRVDA